MEVIAIPTPSLRERSIELSHDVLMQEKTQQFIDELIPTMYDDDGIGIAAPQVGNNIRVCIIGKDAIPKRHELAGKDIALVNPRYIKTSKKTHIETEGCLSVPGAFGPVKRSKDIEVTALTRDGEEITFPARGFFARVIQHEIDHLDGILYIDRAESLTEMEHEKKIDFSIILENVRKI